MFEILKTFPYWFQVSAVLVPVLSFCVAAVAFAINVRQTIINNTLTRAKIVSDTLHVFMDDETIQSAFYKIEYGEFKYDHNFHGSESEKEIDKLLRHFANLAIMWKNGLLTVKDIHPIQYFLLRTVGNSQVREYLDFIDHWSKTSDTGGHPYVALNELTRELESEQRAIKQSR